MFEHWEICFSTVAPRYGPIIERLEWHCLGISSVMTVLLWTSWYFSTSQTCAWMLIQKIFFSHDVWFSFPQISTNYQKC
jgi:hypothetical protein